MKGKFISVSMGILFSLMFCSCSTMGFVTDILQISSMIAGAQDNKAASSILEAGANISKAAESITPENEYYIGRSVAASILSNYSIFESPEKELYLNRICRVITEKSSRPELYNGYHVKILDTDEINALTTSGGHIFVTKGLINCAKSEDSLAGVIAHEVAHIQLEHSIKAIKASRWTKAGTTSLNAAINIASDNDAEKMDDITGDIISSMINSGYSHSQEFDADKAALFLMNEAGYNPSSMIDFLEELKLKEKGSFSGFSKTHPSASSRISKAKKELSKLTLSNDTSIFRVERFQETFR